MSTKNPNAPGGHDDGIYVGMVGHSNLGLAGC